MTQNPDLSDLVDFQAKDPQQALDAALAVVRSYCGWQIAPSQSDTAVVWSYDGCTLLLPTLYLTAVTSVTQDGVVVPSTSYVFEEYGIIRAAYGVQFGTTTRATVVFVHGYTAMPDDAAAVVLSLAQRSISDSRGLVTTATGATVARGAEGFGPQLTEGDKGKLAPYTIPGGFA